MVFELEKLEMTILSYSFALVCNLPIEPFGKVSRHIEELVEKRLEVKVDFHF